MIRKLNRPITGDSATQPTSKMRLGLQNAGSKVQPSTQYAGITAPVPTNQGGSFAGKVGAGGVPSVRFAYGQSTPVSVKKVFSPDMAAIGERRMPSRAALDVRNSIKAPRVVGNGNQSKALWARPLSTKRGSAPVPARQTGAVAGDFKGTRGIALPGSPARRPNLGIHR